MAIPNHSLVQFLRISLEPGEKKKIAFQVKKEFLQVVDHEGERKWDETDATFYLGGSQPDSISVSLYGCKTTGGLYKSGAEILKEGKSYGEAKLPFF